MALERSVINYWGASASFTLQQPHPFLMWFIYTMKLSGPHERPQLMNESKQRTYHWDKTKQVLDSKLTLKRWGNRSPTVWWLLNTLCFSSGTELSILFSFEAVKWKLDIGAKLLRFCLAQRPGFVRGIAKEVLYYVVQICLLDLILAY